MYYIGLCYLNIKLNHNNLNVPFEKSKTVSFASSIIKNIVALVALFRFPVKSICCIVFGSESSFFCSLKSIGISL